MRNRKYLGDGTVIYQIQGSLISGEQKIGQDEQSLVYELEYYYDSDGNILSMLYNGTEYYYLKNIQGDIIGILDGSGASVVEYSYDSWGKVIEISGNQELGKRNPFRYRGYYYDEETGFYYVGSRYYDPEVCRFINADTEEALSADHQNLSQYNLYAYCWNNPVNMSDEMGTWPNWAKVIVGAVATVAAVTLSVATGGAALPILVSVAVSTVGGAVDGYIRGGKQGAINGAANGFMLGGLSSLAASAVGAVKTISSYKKTIDTYSSLTKKYKGSGMEAHHIIEKRLVKGSSWKASKMPSIQLTKSVHKGYTKAWRETVKYGTRYTSGWAYKYQLYRASNSVYSGSRVLRMAARYTIWKM